MIRRNSKISASSKQVQKLPFQTLTRTHSSTAIPTSALLASSSKSSKNTDQISSKKGFGFGGYVTLFENIVFCFTGLPSEKKKELTTKIQELGGVVVSHLTIDVNYLLAETVGSEKFRMARACHIPIVLPDWVFICHDRVVIDNENTLRSEDAKKLAHSFTVPPLAGALISVTGFDSDERLKLSHQITELGGKYTSNLSTDCTHLLATTDTSEKFKYAVQWGLPVITVAWLQKIAESKDWVEERSFLLNGTSQKLNSIKATSHCNPSYLEGCVIYLGEGFEENLTRFLKQVVREGGGSLARTCDSLVTHFVCARKVPTVEDDRNIRLIPKHIPVVTFCWLRSCYASQCLVDTQKHLVSSTSAVDDPGRILCQDTRSGWSNAGLPLVESSQQSRQGVLKKNISRPAVAPIMTIKVFTNIIFCLDGFSRDETTLLERAIKDKGGQIVSSLEQTLDCRSYWLVPFHYVNRSVPGNPSKTNVGTEYWFQNCIQENKLLPLTESFLFRPTLNTFPLSGTSSFQIGVSGYDGVLREHLSRLASTMGAEWTESFSKKNTHLICHPEKGKQSLKYQKALEWGIPVVTAEWLLACVEKGILVDTNEFSILKGAVAHSKDDILDSNEGPLDIALDTTKILQTFDSLKNDEGTKKLTPKKFTKEFGLQLVSAVDRVLANSSIMTPEKEQLPREKIKIPTNRTDYVTDRDHDHIFSGLRVVLSQDIPATRRDKLLETLIHFGGSLCSESDMESATHVVVNRDNTKSMQNTAGKKGNEHVCFVTEDWVLACKDAKAIVNESHFPAFPAAPFSSDTKLGDDNDEQNKKENISSAHDVLADNSAPKQDGFQSKLDALYVVMNNTSSREAPVSSSEQEPPRKKVKLRPETMLLTQDYLDDVVDYVPSKTKDKPSRIVRYHDAHAAKEQMELLSVLQNPNDIKSVHEDEAAEMVPTPVSDEGGLLGVTEKNSRSVSIPASSTSLPRTRKKSPGPFKFLLSGIPMEERNHIATSIRNLGGILLQNDTWSDECSHLIVGKATKSEKFLASCAAGVWILHTSYIRESVKMCKFANEDDFTLDFATHGRFALAASKLLHQPTRLFEGWTVLHAIVEPKKEAFIRVLRAGGAEVDVLRPPFNFQGKKVYKMCILYDDEYAYLKKNTSLLRQLDCPIVRSGYVVDYIMDTETPDIERYQFV